MMVFLLDFAIFQGVKTALPLWGILLIGGIVGLIVRLYQDSMVEHK